MYDAIIVGARAPVDPTAMLLARRGYRVLLVDQPVSPATRCPATYIHQPGVAALERWGVADAVRVTNCPPISSLRFDVLHFARL